MAFYYLSNHYKRVSNSSTDKGKAAILIYLADTFLLVITEGILFTGEFNFYVDAYAED